MFSQNTGSKFHALRKDIYIPDQVNQSMKIDVNEPALTQATIH